MRALLKRFLHSRLAVRIGADAVALYVRLVRFSSRWQLLGSEHPAPFWQDGRPFITAFWHGRLLMMPTAWTGRRPVSVLISQHRDGELIARAMSAFDIGTIRGSAAKNGRDKGGGAALRAIVQRLRQGEYVTITPDGPRGPRMRAGIGIVAAARLARVPILPAAYAVARRRVARSWDRFIIPWPFNRGVFIWGAPIDVSDAEESIEQAAQRVEDALNRLTAEADRLCGQMPVEPAERQADERQADA
ncbi:lysophospholipid acyltransferase family protein [Ferrovibrio sp.]|uniref:lysophospholipid acyltransferase family protein n=1 Tax=Ferrovibrio sp. TaxID=1917215 RepID=UPI00311EEA29